MNQQEIIIIRTLKPSTIYDERDIPELDWNNWSDNEFHTQQSVGDLLRQRNPGSLSSIYMDVTLVHSATPSRSTVNSLVDRFSRCSGYRINNLWWIINLAEYESDTKGEIKRFLDEYYSWVSKKVLLIISWLPWIPALIQEWLDIPGVQADMSLNEMQYLVPSWCAFGFNRNAK